MRVYDTFYYKMFLNGTLRDYAVFSSDTIAWYNPELTDQEILDKLQDNLELDMASEARGVRWPDRIADQSGDANTFKKQYEQVWPDDREKTLKFTSDDINMFGGGSIAKNIK